MAPTESASRLEYVGEPPPEPNAKTGIATAAAMTPAIAPMNIGRRVNRRVGLTFSAFSGGKSDFRPAISS
jgi:hypothetical protein